MDQERWERITSPLRDPLAISPEDQAFRDAWSALASGLAASSASGDAPDPDDVWMEITRRERRRRKTVWLRTSAVAASVALAALLLAVGPWRGPSAAEPKMASVTPSNVSERDVSPWDDGWE